MTPGGHRRSVAARFSSAARTYDRGAAIFENVARELLTFLPDVEAPVRLLEIGSGTGILTALLVERFSASRVVAIDAAPGMIEGARRKACLRGRVEWHAADILDFHHPPVPLVVSSSSLHWVTPLETLFGKIHGLVNACGRDGHLVFSIMLEGTLGELHAARVRVAPDKPVHARLPRAADVTQALETAGFAIEAQRKDVVPARHESATAFLQQIHELGVTGGDVSAADHRLTRGELAALKDDYEENYKVVGEPYGGVRASYHVLYVRAVKPQEGIEGMEMP